MAKFDGILKKLKGSVGNLTFNQVNGETVVSEKATTVKNTRTPAQQRQRTKWGNVVQMYKGVMPLINNNDEMIAEYSGNDAYKRSVQTYGGENSAFLTPGSIRVMD